MSSKDAAEVKHEKDSQGAVAEGEVEAKSEQKEANKVSEGKGSEGGGDGDENVVPGKASPTNVTNAESSKSMESMEAKVDDDKKVQEEEGLSLDKTITRFRFQYDKLHRSLARSMDAERRLVGETKNLRLQLLENTKKIELAYKWKSEDQKTIKLLRRELKKAWETAEVFRQKELRAQELISTLKGEIVSLSDHAHASFNRSNTANISKSLVSSRSSMNIGDMENPDSPLKGMKSLMKRTGIKNDGIPNFEEWKRRNKIHTPSTSQRKIGPREILRRPRTTPIKRRPRTPLEYARERS